MSDKTDIDYAYVAINKEGRAQAIHMDDLEYKKSVADFVSEHIRDGYTIERMTRDEAMEKMR